MVLWRVELSMRRMGTEEDLVPWRMEALGHRCVGTEEDRLPWRVLGCPVFKASGHVEFLMRQRLCIKYWSRASRIPKNKVSAMKE